MYATKAPRKGRPSFSLHEWLGRTHEYPIPLIQQKGCPESWRRRVFMIHLFPIFEQFPPPLSILLLTLPQLCAHLSLSLTLFHLFAVGKVGRRGKGKNRRNRFHCLKELEKRKDAKRKDAGRVLSNPPAIFQFPVGRTKIFHETDFLP